MEEGWGQGLGRLAGTVAEVAGVAGGDEVVVPRLLDAPRALVFETWTGPKHVAH